MLDAAVGQPQVTLVGLDDVEQLVAALDPCAAAAECQIGVVDARPRAGVEDDAAPITVAEQRRGDDRPGRVDRLSECVELVRQVAVGVEGPARAVAVVGEAGEDDTLARQSLGDQLADAAFQFDP